MIEFKPRLTTHSTGRAVSLPFINDCWFNSHRRSRRAFGDFGGIAAKAPGPRPVAEAILKAAEDSSPKLRYPVKGAFILALTSLLPDAIWRSLLGAGMTRRSKNSVSR